MEKYKNNYPKIRTVHKFCVPLIQANEVHRTTVLGFAKHQTTKTMKLISKITAKETSYNEFEVENKIINTIIASCKVLDRVALDQDDMLEKSTSEEELQEMMTQFCRKYGYWVSKNVRKIEYHSHTHMVSRPIVSEVIGEMDFELYEKEWNDK